MWIKKAVQTNVVVVKMPCRIHLCAIAMANGVPTCDVIHKRSVLMKMMNNSFLFYFTKHRILPRLKICVAVHNSIP